MGMIALAASVPMRAAAQNGDTQERQAELMQRLDSLVPILAEAQAEADAVKARCLADIRSRSAPAVDTISIGPVRVVTLPDQVDEARELFGEVLSEFEVFNDSPTMRAGFITFQWATEFQGIYLEPESGPVQHVQHRRWRSRGHVRDAIRGAVAGMLQSDLWESRITREWLNARIGTPDDLARSYRELVALPSQMSQKCLAGEGDACWSALGLDASGTSLEEWYTPQERHAYAVRVWGNRFYSG